MTTRTITADQTVAFWRYMCRKYGTKVRNREDAGEMQVIAAVLASMDIMDAKKFLTRYTQTLGHRIYPCFEIGDPGRVALAEQAIICVHEHVHVRQFHSADFVWDYCLDSSKRTLHECEAYRANMELAFWFSGRCPAPRGYVKTLLDYQVSQDDQAFALTYLTKAAEVVKRGGIVTPEAQVAVRWLGPRLATA
jgi:hypothetical protein